MQMAATAGGHAWGSHTLGLGITARTLTPTAGVLAANVRGRACSSLAEPLLSKALERLLPTTVDKAALQDAAAGARQLLEQNQVSVLGDTQGKELAEANNARGESSSPFLSSCYA